MKDENKITNWSEAIGALKQKWGTTIKNARGVNRSVSPNTQSAKNPIKGMSDTIQSKVPYDVLSSTLAPKRNKHDIV